MLRIRVSARGESTARRGWLCPSRPNRLANVVAVLIMVLPFLSIPVAVADPPAGARITDIQHVNDRWDKVSVYSPAMDKVVVNDVFKAPKSGSPTFYLLPGIDGGEQPRPWR